MKNGLLVIPLLVVILVVAGNGLQNRKQSEWAVSFRRHGQDVLAIAAKDRAVAHLLAKPPTEARRQALAQARLEQQQAVQTERADRRPLEGYFKTMGR
jgi:hypothetical protein